MAAHACTTRSSAKHRTRARTAAACFVAYLAVCTVLVPVASQETNEGPAPQEPVNSRAARQDEQVVGGDKPAPFGVAAFGAQALQTAVSLLRATASFVC